MSPKLDTTSVRRRLSAAACWLLQMIGVQPGVSRCLRAELEQATLRVAIGGIVLVYLLVYTHRDGVVDPSELEVDFVALAFFLFGLAIMVRTLISGNRSVLRRVVGMVADNAVTSYCLLRMGEGGAVVLGVYLFVSFGNGFRYGRTYLHASQVLALLGFSLVLLLSPFWSQHLAIATGLLIAMVVLPLYVGVLAERINEAKKRADEANQAKGRFLANVSHEMRTPLNGVIAMADVLRETQLSQSQQEIVDTLATSAHLLLAQIEDVLDMAKIEASRVQIERRPFHLAQLLANTVKVVLPQARHKGLALTTEVAPALDRPFEGDAHHLRQVLLNLLANAVKFTERGKVDLRARPVRDIEGGVCIRFEVQDTGIGIPAEKHASIFEPFTQADDSITRIYGGTGLGTTIARQLVLLMGGSIGLESTPGKGSLFWVELPLSYCTVDDIASATDSDPSNDVRADANATYPVRRSHAPGARILVAEDNPTNQRVAQLILESGGYRPTLVNSGEAALDELEAGGYDLALFDLSMPGVSGLEALRMYRFTASNPIPILMLSANVTSEVIAECMSAGAAEFIPKPIRPATLLDALGKYLNPKFELVADPAVSRLNPHDSRRVFTVVEPTIIDGEVLADLDRLSPDPTFVPRLLAGFRCDAERLAKEIAEHLATAKFELVKDSAHALKGGAGSVGATQLTFLATRLEKANYETLRAKANEWTDELLRATSDALNILDRHAMVHQQSVSG